MRAAGLRALPVLTLVNALAAAGSALLKPAGSNWGAGKLVTHATWETAGYASLGLLAGWLVLCRGKRLQVDRRAQLGIAIAAAHALLWLLLPSWS